MQHSPNMHKLREFYETILEQIDITGSILEIGCGPSEKTILNMPILKNAKYRIGINLTAYNHYEDFDVVECNSNNMKDYFEDHTFDIIISNCVFEHDRYFWKSLEEIRRIIKPKGTFILGVPALVNNIDKCKYVIDDYKNQIKNLNIINSTLTYCVHNAPGDYWRFTEQAYKEVLMEGFKEIWYKTILMPPLIVGYGKRK